MFRHSRKGFTLIELMVTVVIIGILAAVAVPAYNGYVQQAKYAEAYTSIDAIKKGQINHYLENKMFLTFTAPWAPSKGEKLPFVQSLIDGSTINMELWNKLGKPLSDSGYYFTYTSFAGATDAAMTHYEVTSGVSTLIEGSFDGQSGAIAKYSGGSCLFTFDYSGMGVGQTPNESWVMIAAVANFKTSDKRCTVASQSILAHGADITTRSVIWLSRE